VGEDSLADVDVAINKVKWMMKDGVVVGKAAKRDY
jgi:hypothetical protein